MSVRQCIFLVFLLAICILILYTSIFAVDMMYTNLGQIHDFHLTDSSSFHVRGCHTNRPGEQTCTITDPKYVFMNLTYTNPDFDNIFFQEDNQLFKEDEVPPPIITECIYQNQPCRFTFDAFLAIFSFIPCCIILPNIVKIFIWFQDHCCCHP